MDWGKAKTILIFTFLLLNLLLGYQLYLKYSESDYQLWGKESEKEIHELLKEHKITIKSCIPTDKPTMHFIRANLISFDGELMYSAADYDKITEKEITSILADSGQNIDEFVYNEQESIEGSHYVFFQMESGFFIFGGHLTVDLVNNKVLTYKQDYLEVVGEGSGRKIISAMTAIKSAIDLRLIPDGSEIISLALGYYGEGVQSILYEIPPVWRLVYKADDIINVLHINAITGENVLKLG